MKNSIKILLTLFVLIFIVQFSISVSAITIPSATGDFYVNDFAGVFTEDEKNRLTENAIALSNEHDGIQVVVTTVTSLDGATVEEFAFSMYNKYEIGKDDMGILILLSTGDRQIRVEVGKAMEAYINDSKAGKFIDNYAIPYLKDNKFNEGLISLQEALISEITNCVKVDNIETQIINTENTSFGTRKYNNLKIIFTLFSILSAIIFVIQTIIIFKLKTCKDTIQDDLTKSNKDLKDASNIAQKYYRELSSLRKEYEEKLRNSLSEKDKMELQYENALINIGDKVTKLNSSITDLESNLSALQDRYSRAIKLHPNLETEIEDMINQEKLEYDKACAKEVEILLKEFIDSSASKDIVSKVHYALSKYAALENEQKAHITIDVSKIHDLHDASCKLKVEYEKEMQDEADKKQADVVRKYISNTLADISTVTASDFDLLKSLKSRYDEMSPGAKLHFDNTVIKKLRTLLERSKHDLSIKTQVETAENTITSAIRYISVGREDDLDNLCNVKQIYEKLPNEARNRFEPSIINMLNRLIDDAERDKRRNEEERRKRKRDEEEKRRRNNHSNFGGFGGHSGGGFSGFGGSSGGGGASRGF